MNERAIKLLNYLGLSHDTEVKESEYDDNTFIVEGKEYQILTDEEADEAHEEYISNFIDDCGISAFTPYAQRYIIENYMDKSWFNEAMIESYESYVEDIKLESSSDKDFENRLEEEISDTGCEDEESYVEYLCSQYSDGVEWYIDNFGEADFFKICKETCHLDISGISEFCIREDGRGHSLATYDGNELELDDNYYAYKLN